MHGCRHIGHLSDALGPTSRTTPLSSTYPWGAERMDEVGRFSIIRRTANCSNAAKKVKAVANMPQPTINSRLGFSRLCEPSRKLMAMRMLPATNNSFDRRPCSPYLRSKNEFDMTWATPPASIVYRPAAQAKGRLCNLSRYSGSGGGIGGALRLALHVPSVQSPCSTQAGTRSP
jgi:hypothetical protein